VDETVAWTTDDMHENPARCAVPPASSDDPFSADTSNRMLPMTFDTVCELSREGSATTLARDCRASLAELASKLLAFSLMAADTLLTMLPCKSCDANSLLPLFDCAETSWDLEAANNKSDDTSPEYESLSSI